MRRAKKASAVSTVTYRLRRVKYSIMRLTVIINLSVAPCYLHVKEPCPILRKPTGVPNPKLSRPSYASTAKSSKFKSREATCEKSTN